MTNSDPPCGGAALDGGAVLDGGDARPAGARCAEADCFDVVVVGGGLGGVAAALSACAAGARVLLTEAGDRLGGQVTAQLTAPLDEHPLIESPSGCSASYARLREAVRARYGGRANPGGGWVSRLCFEPAVGRSVLDHLVAPYLRSGSLTVRYGLRPIAVRTRTAADGRPRATALHLADPSGASVRVEIGGYLLDATELGDLLALAGVPWVVGSEGRDAYGEPAAVPGGPDPAAEQSSTWCFVVAYRPGEDHTIARPDGYDQLREQFSLDVAGWDGTVHRYRMLTNGPDGKPPFWTYRRVRDGAVLGGPDVALINWGAHDYAGAGLVGDPQRAWRESRRLAEAFLYWLQTECPRDDGRGRGYPELAPDPVAAGTPDGFATHPYVRESRRLRVAHPVSGADICLSPGEDPATAPATRFSDTVGIAWYHADMHPRVGHPDPVYAPTRPFQLPLRALVCRELPNLLPAAKNLGATQVAAAAYRVHHGEWAVGEAAGALAVYCLDVGTDPVTVAAVPARVLDLQRRLLAAGVPLAWIPDVPRDAPGFAEAQLELVHAARPDVASTPPPTPASRP